MKKLVCIAALLMTAMWSTPTLAQSDYECRNVLNSNFGTYSNDKAVTLNRLGTSPQFGEIKVHSSAGAYSHLNRVYKRNSRKSRVEIDRLLQLLGYSGFNDPAFGESKIIAETLYKGQRGWMGAYSRGYQYRWSELGKDFPTFRILAKDGPCFLYIMKKCGNAFYIPNMPGVVDCPPCPDCPRPMSFMANADPYCPACAPCPPPCQTSTMNVSGSGKINSGDKIENSMEMPLVAAYGGEKLCLGTYSVPVRSTYEYTATGSASFSEIIELCDNGGGVLQQMDMKLPVNLDFDLTDSQMSVGENGQMVMNVVNEKRFKRMKKLYPACPADVTTESAEALMAETMDDAEAMTTSTMNEGAKGDGDSYCTKQTLFFNGSEQVSEVVDKNFSNTVTVIGYYNKVGKLANGETADKYLCLGTYAVPGSTSLLYNLKGESSLSKVLEVCDKEGTAPAERQINVPVDLDLAMNEQKMSIGDGGRVMIPLTEKQYKKLGKNFSRCCSDGSKGCF